MQRIKKDILSNLTPQEDSDNRNTSRDRVTTNFTVITVLICQTGYTSPMIVHSLETFPKKGEIFLVLLENGNLKMTLCGSHSETTNSSGRR